MIDCVYCAILSGEQPASIVHDDHLVVAFMDINPVNPGHTLVVPRSHVVGLADLPPETGAAMFAMGRRIAAALRSSDVPCDGINLFLADGAAAGQEVFHVHLHVIPRLTRDGFQLRVDYAPPPSRHDLDRIARRLRGSLSASSPHVT